VCVCMCVCSRKARLCNDCVNDQQQVTTSDTGDDDSDTGSDDADTEQPVHTDPRHPAGTADDDDDDDDENDTVTGDDSVLSASDSAAVTAHSSQVTPLSSSSSSSAVPVVAVAGEVGVSAAVTWSMRDSAYSALTWVSDVMSRGFVRQHSTSTDYTTAPQPADDTAAAATVTVADVGDEDEADIAAVLSSDDNQQTASQCATAADINEHSSVSRLTESPATAADINEYSSMSRLTESHVSDSLTPASDNDTSRHCLSTDDSVQR